MKVLLLNNVPAPYFNPLFERLGRESGWALTVCYVTARKNDIGWGEQPPDSGAAYRTIILDGEPSRLKDFLGRPAATVRLLGVLARERPDYLISYGYWLPPQAAAISWAVATGRPFAVIGDANYYNDHATGVRRAVKGMWLKQVIRHAAALITVGTASRMFWEAYGARPDKLFESRYVVDNDFFARAAEERREEAAELRARWGLEEAVVFLYVGRLVRRKGIDLLLRAASRLADENVAVIVAGDGEDRQALEELAQGGRRVIFAGRLEPGELPLYYAMADALVLPARDEPWGLVVNEAMASGLAVIAHRHCGAAVDLVGPDNGVALETFSVAELVEAMRLIAADGGRRRAMRRRSREKIRDWSVAEAARGIIRAVEGSSRPRLSQTVASELGKLE